MKVAATSGGLGDIVYAIPIMHKLNVTKVYVKEAYYYPPYGNLHSAIKSLLAQQGIEALPTSGAYPPFQYEPTIKYDFDLDASRRQPMRGRNHIIVSYLNEFRLSHDGWKEPWLKVQGAPLVSGYDYTVIHRTSRWRRYSPVKWADVINSLTGPLIFVGFENEYQEFIQEIGFLPEHMAYLPTDDILQMAIVIRDSKALYSNQSVSVTLAQGLGKDYWLETNGPKTNCLMYTPNEHVL